MYATYANDIFRFLLAHTREVELAEDLTADTFTKAWHKIGSFDGKHERGWLYKIAQNTLNDYWRKKKTLPLDETIEIEDDTAGIEEQIDKAFDASRIDKALATLPVHMRSVVVLRFMEGYSVKQVGEALNVSESNVRVLQYRALKKLQGELS